MGSKKAAGHSESSFIGRLAALLTVLIFTEPIFNAAIKGKKNFPKEKY